MEKENVYRIPLSGLALGDQAYHFDVKDDFFEGMDYSEIQHGNISVDVTVSKNERMVTFHFIIKGTVRVICDRCADEFDLPISNEEDFFVKFGTEAAEESDNVVVVSAEQHDYDIRSLIYEYIILSIPFHRVHPEGECNPDVLQMINRQEAPAAEEAEPETDPRWAALKDIKLEDK